VTPAELRTLAAEATPGPWGAWPDLGANVLRAQADGGYTRLAVFDDWDAPDGINVQVDARSNARLAALAPDLAVLAADMADYIAHMEKYWGGGIAGSGQLLARLSALETRDQQDGAA
jgi:hypothetical protein